MSQVTNSINSIPIELTIVLGTASMPIHHLLKMGRGAVIELETHADQDVQILANNTPIAKGEVVVHGDKIAVSVKQKLMRQNR